MHGVFTYRIIIKINQLYLSLKYLKYAIHRPYMNPMGIVMHYDIRSAIFSRFSMVKLETHHPRIYAEIVEMKQVKFGCFVSFNRKGWHEKHLQDADFRCEKNLKKTLRSWKISLMVVGFQRFCDLTFS